MFERLRELWAEERDRTVGRELAYELIRYGESLAGVRILFELGDTEIVTEDGLPINGGGTLDNLLPYKGVDIRVEAGTYRKRLTHKSTGVPLLWSGADFDLVWGALVLDRVAPLAEDPGLVYEVVDMFLSLTPPTDDERIDLSDDLVKRFRENCQGQGTHNDRTCRILLNSRSLVELYPVNLFIDSAREMAGISGTHDPKRYAEELQWQYEQLVDIATGRVDPRE